MSNYNSNTKIQMSIVSIKTQKGQNTPSNKTTTTSTSPHPTSSNSLRAYLNMKLKMESKTPLATLTLNNPPYFKAG